MVSKATKEEAEIGDRSEGLKKRSEVSVLVVSFVSWENALIETPFSCICHSSSPSSNLHAVFLSFLSLYLLVILLLFSLGSAPTGHRSRTHLLPLFPILIHSQLVSFAMFLQCVWQKQSYTRSSRLISLSMWKIWYIVKNTKHAWIFILTYFLSLGWEPNEERGCCASRTGDFGCQRRRPCKIDRTWVAHQVSAIQGC